MDHAETEDERGNLRHNSRRLWLLSSRGCYAVACLLLSGLLLLGMATRGVVNGSTERHRQGAVPGSVCSVDRGLGRERVKSAEDGCAAGIWECCAQAGDAYLRRRFGLNDDGHALALFEQACAAGHACQTLAAMYRQGRGGPPNPERASEVESKEAALKTSHCDAGIAEGCLALAEMIDARAAELEIPRAQHLRERAQRIYEAQCQTGDAEGCLGVALMLLKHDPLSRRIDTLLETACAAGVARGCYFKAVEMGSSRRSKLEPKSAVQYFERSCELGESQGCLHAAAAYDRGEHVLVDRARALVLFGKACEAGNPEGCLGAARVMRRAGPERNMQQAKRLLHELCSTGEEAGCSELTRWRTH
jgi:TPR repeat protein